MSRLQDASLSVLFGGGDGSQCNVRAKKASFSSCLLCDATSSHNSIALLGAYFFLFSFVLWWWIYLSDRSFMHMRLDSRRVAPPTSLTLLFVLFPLFPLSFLSGVAPCAMRHAPCAAPPWWSDYDDWRLVPHGNGPWQWRHGRPWSMAAPSPFPPPPPVSPVSLFLSFLSCSFCLELEGGSRGNRTHSTVPGLAWWKTISKTGEKRRSMQW